MTAPRDSINSVDTIAALATPSGRGGVGIVRVSGPAVTGIARAILGQCPKPRYAVFTPFRDPDGTVIDTGLAIFFRAPHSFTGEDVLELQGHGGPVVMDLLLRAVLELGARPARAGEFSERAFLNDKLDLIQAEAIADLIDAGSEQAARTALRSLQGAFSTAIHELVTNVTRLRVYVEAAMDFPDEDIDFISEGKVTEQLTGLQDALTGILAQAQQGSLIREGINVVLVGKPNAGKSSLLNALARREAAIVTDIPGTTRDIVKEALLLDGLPLHVLDTAGLRDSQDKVEQEGMRRTWQAVEQADLLLLIVDDNDGLGDLERDILARIPAGLAVVIIYNKCDMSGRAAGKLTTQADSPDAVVVSAKHQSGLNDLVTVIKSVAGMQASGEGSFMARRRHLHALRRAEAHLTSATKQAAAGMAELIADDLKQVQQCLGEITGEVTSDDLLGEIFSAFCIGK